MSANQQSRILNPLQIARQLAAGFAENAAYRDARGGTPKAERDAI
ncbi:monooxygenase, partial [Pseudomonas sp. UMC631]|nr:monooxygenase [Pseudomonas sp. UMC631]